MADRPESPRYGRRLLQHLIDDIVRVDPDRIFARTPLGRSARDGYCSITVRQLATAIDRAAWWIKDNMPTTLDLEDRPVWAYIGPQDYRYEVLMLGAVKAGVLLFMPSPRNSKQAHLALLERYKCSTLMLPEGPVFRSMVSEVLQQRTMRLLDVPDLTYFFGDGRNMRPFPWSMSYEDGRTQPIAGLQTSGSTGIPKPIPFCQAMFSATDAYQRFSEPQKRGCLTVFGNKRVILAFPFFHAAGIMLAFYGLMYNYIPVLPLPGPLSAATIAEVISQEEIEGGLLPPSIIVDMSADPALVEHLRKLQYVVYGGGPLPGDIGRRVTDANMTHLINVFGTSETGYTVSELIGAEDWQYLKWAEHTGIEMRPYAEDLHEMVAVRRPDLEDFQGVFCTFPHLEEYKTGDLFSAHPSENGLWQFRGRSDDIVVFSTGEKFNPTTVEDVLNGLPIVKAALVTGDARFQSALLVEPADWPADGTTADSLIDALWPTVAELNKQCPGYAKMSKQMILIAKPDRPFPRAGKGTVQRRLAVKMYEAELDSLYAGLERRSMVNGDTTNPNAGFEDFAESLRGALTSSGAFGDLSLDDNLFDRGMDSLGVLNLVRTARSLTGRYHLKREVTAKDVYESRTLRELARSLQAPKTEAKPAAERMQEFYERYSTDLPVTARSPVSVPLDGKIVLLTGSTGQLGSYLLAELLRDPKVAGVICLNRTSDAEQRQRNRMVESGLSSDFSSKTVSFLHADFSKPYCGLELKAYRHLLARVSKIIHNAWQVNFNMPLEQFIPTHLNGVRQIIEFSARSRHGASILFVSSIGTMMGWTQAMRRCSPDNVPEETVEDWDVAQEGGYGQSKLVAERVLDAAAKIAGVPCTVCRVGQVAGPTTSEGMWQKQEWLPSLVVSSVHLGALPASLGPLNMIDWVPVDLMARSLVEVSNMAAKPTLMGAVVYNVVNPQRTTWAALLPSLQERLGLSAVSLTDWISKLESIDRADTARYPAIKLLDFFKGLNVHGEDTAPRFETARTQQASPTLESLQPVNSTWMDLWLRQWGLQEA
ncbi:hypothetical protein BAUCODRAFT_62089 [Baudoinia panamericana UAMH 10762]|uniref:Carrier domain-containing protein n=1 Tax=Baudoinia panamericana (strain UAMH 10762) TaxID=717646 RepID=M2M1T4_BAUPA|nr:uncharacterized protein BAUCODRAFT_62089 [Baudoinia panamericana UAMH 10762]EMD01008.1 hypothetical protein BAUCODRAFT_62089 [Baudoinia panamericana UAMH 10762]